MTMMTAAEKVQQILEMRGTLAPVEPQPDRVQLPANFYPSEAEIRRRASVNGHNVELARTELIDRARNEFSRLSEVVPHITGLITEQLEEAERLRSAAETMLNQTVSEVGVLEAGLLEFANANAAVDQIRARLQGAKDALQAPSAVDLNAATLFKLNMEISELPAQIKEGESRVESLRGQVRAQASNLGIDPSSMVKVLARRAGHNVMPGSPNGHTAIVDPHVHRLIEGGFMSID